MSNLERPLVVPHALHTGFAGQYRGAGRRGSSGASSPRVIWATKWPPPSPPPSRRATTPASSSAQTSLEVFNSPVSHFNLSTQKNLPFLLNLHSVFNFEVLKIGFKQQSSSFEHFNLQIRMPKCKSRSEMGLLNTLQERTHGEPDGVGGLARKL